MADKTCAVCSGTSFQIAHDEWMKRTFKFVENGQLSMCQGCGAKYLVCKGCGGNYTRVHPGLEAWEVDLKCPSCGHHDPDVDFFISQS